MRPFHEINVSGRKAPAGYIEGQYFKCRTDVLDDPTTTAATRLVYVALASFATAEGHAWPSRERIAARAGVGRSTVDRELRRLAQAGYLTRTARPNVRGKRLTTMYHLGPPLPPHDGERQPRGPDRPREGGNVTPMHRAEDYRDPENDAAVAALVARFGSARNGPVTSA